MNHPLFKILESPANWCGMGLSVLGPFLAAADVINIDGAAAFGLAAVGYVLGFAVGGKAFGFPNFSMESGECHETLAQHQAHMKIVAALATIRYRVETNPEQRLRRAVRERIFTLCDMIESLISQWGQSKTTLPFEDTFNAQQIAVKFLPAAINRFSAIPKSFASTEVLDNGKTALQTFEETLDSLMTKITEIKNKLAHQEAQALLNHATFVNQKFK
jgi:hypothetical protein